MPLFEYTARAPSGQIQKGQLDVASKDDVHLSGFVAIQVDVAFMPPRNLFVGLRPA